MLLFLSLILLLYYIIINMHARLSDTELSYYSSDSVSIWTEICCMIHILQQDQAELTIQHLTTYLGKEFYLLFMRWLLYSTAANHSLCSKQSEKTSVRINFKLKKLKQVNVNRATAMKSLCLWNHVTKVSNELLGNVHPFEKLLKEAVGKTLLNGGDVLLHVLQSPEEDRKVWKNVLKRQKVEKNLNWEEESALLALSQHIHWVGGTSANPEPSPCPWPSP